MYVCDNPRIYTGCDVRVEKDKLNGYPLNYKGGMKENLLIRDLWTQGTDSIHDMRAVNTDATSYQSKISEKFLETTEKEKKNNYLDSCLKHCLNLTPFIASVGGLLGVEAKATIKRIASRLVTKWKEAYSRTCGYFKSRFVNHYFPSNALLNPGWQGYGLPNHRKNAPSGRMVRAYTSLGKNRGPPCPRQLKPPSLLSPLHLETKKVSRALGIPHGLNY